MNRKISGISKINIRVVYKVIYRLVALFLMTSLLVVAPGCSNNGRDGESNIVPGSSILPPPKKPVTDATMNASDEIVIKGVLTKLDIDNKKMNFADIEDNVEYEVPYSGGTDIQNKYGTIIAAAAMKLGGIYNVTCDSKGIAKTIYGAADSWERDGITGIEIDEKNKTLTVGALQWNYVSHTSVMSGEEKISIASLVDQDEVTIRGVDKTVYSISLDKGHGYLKLTGIDSFIGGYVSVGKQQFLQITSGMVITAQEGRHNIELQNGSLRADKMVTIEKNQEASLDFSEYVKPAVQNGTVKFLITPKDAILTIDGKETDYSDIVNLSYGTHKIVVKASKYVTYTENYTVKTAYETKIIDLTSTDSTKASTSSGNTDGYNVKVTAPVGATLYVDSAYVGVIPCTFKKKSGNRIVTLSKQGFSTVSYTISVSDEKGDVTYAFPDMVSNSLLKN